MTPVRINPQEAILLQGLAPTASGLWIDPGEVLLLQGMTPWVWGAPTSALLSAVRTLLTAVSGVSRATVRVGGRVPWGETPRPYQSYWETRMVRRPQRDSTFGLSTPRMDALPVLQIEGWMPWSNPVLHKHYPDSQPVWDDLVDAVAAKLRDNRSLSLTVSDASLPQLITENLAEKGDDVTKGVVCPHCLLEVSCVDSQPYSKA